MVMIQSHFSQAISCNNFEKWLEAIIEKLKSMEKNYVWIFEVLLESYRRVACKWVFKTVSGSLRLNAALMVILNANNRKLMYLYPHGKWRWCVFEEILLS